MTTTHPGLSGGPIYLDYNATTPVDPRVTEAMLPHLTHQFGNPSNNYTYGQTAAQALARARNQTASLIGAGPESITVCGSGSEANNLAIRGAVVASGNDHPHVITQTSEHPAVLKTCAALKRLHHATITYLPVDGDGRVDPADLEDAIGRDTVLVSIMHANNETGVTQPITALAAIAHEHGALFHTDAAQTVGKIDVDVTELGADLLTIVGHKLYAPKGIGALYHHPLVRLEPIVYGGGQEHGLRSGTENVALAVALGTAATLAADAISAGEPQRLANLRDRLHDALDTALPGRVAVNGSTKHRLPHVLNVSITEVDGNTLLAAAPGIAAATGSACHTGTTLPSPVLTAMGIDTGRAASAVRLSLGRWTTESDIEQAASTLIAAAVRSQ